MLRKLTMLFFLWMLISYPQELRADGKDLISSNDNQIERESNLLKLSDSKITWTVVDIMSNAFSAASNYVKPMAYDPATQALNIIHPAHTSYGANSGQLFYNLSTNLGGNWQRVSELNTINPKTARFPSCVISNPLKSPNISDALLFYISYLITGSVYTHIMLGVEVVGFSTPYSISEPYLSGPLNPRVWASDNTNHIYWIAGSKIGKFTDGYISNDSINLNGVNFDIGAQCKNGISYIGAIGNWQGDSTNVLNLGYSKSTNNGTTWSHWIRPQPNWLSVPGIKGSIYDDWYEVYSFDMLVDADNYVHFFGVVKDTITNARAIVEIYETQTGWAGNIVNSNLKPYTLLNYDSINLGHNLNASITSDGNILFVLWLDAGGVSDSLPDIWGSIRHKNYNNWGSCTNLTYSPQTAELLIHSSPIVHTSMNYGYLFVTRAYDINSSSYPPDPNVSTWIYAGHVNFITGNINEHNNSKYPLEYSLKQNYPNPFNSLTNIEYYIGKSSNVKIEVFDMLGRNVAVLLNERKEPGIHNVTWDASNFNSGIYYYRLTTGDYVEVRKMLLIK